MTLEKAAQAAWEALEGVPWSAVADMREDAVTALTGLRSPKSSNDYLRSGTTTLAGMMRR